MRRRDDVRPGRPRSAPLRPVGAISLARALSKFGVCSRREAERWIGEGRVSVDGAVARDPARWIEPARHRIRVDGQEVADQTTQFVVALHKPVGLVTTRVDPGRRPTVYDALGDIGRWVFPVGRLDRDTSGLLVLTNDHRLGERLTSPREHVPKTYHARVEGVPDEAALRAMREGIPLADELTRPAQVRLLGSQRGTSWLEVVLTEGRNRQLRRMCSAVGHDVVELVRVAIGELTLTALGLAPGEWRELTAEERLQLVGPQSRPSVGRVGGR